MNQLDIKITNTKHNPLKNLYQILLTITFSYIWNSQSYWFAVASKTSNELSHLNEQNLTHNFRDFHNPPCSCKLELETTVHYLLRCHLIQIKHRELSLMTSKK